MKRIIALILSSLLLLGSVLNVSSQSNEIVITETEEAVSLLKYIGIAEEDEDLSAQVSRAEFAEYVAKAIKAASSSGKQYYYDVDIDLWAFDAISALTELGYFSGGENMSFRPNDIIRFTEATKVIVSMVGYGDLAKAKGGFPSGYLQVANRLGITKNINGEFVTKQQVYVMLYRAMNTALYNPTVISEKGIEYAADEEETIFSVYHDIYYIEGTVNAVGVISLSSSVKLREGEAQVDEKILKVNEISQDMYDYLGMYIKGYFVETSIKNANLVAVFPYGKKNNVITIERKRIAQISDNNGLYTFRFYDEGDEIEKIEVPRGCIVVKNGVSITSNLFSEFDIEKGSYKFLDYNGDEEIDVLFISEYYNLTVGLVENKEGMTYIETENNTEYYRGQIGSTRVIYDKFDASHAIDVTEESGKIIKFKDANGMLISINDIVVPEVLSVYKSKDGNYVEICKGKGTVKGTVSSISYPNEDIVSVIINETEYEMDKDITEKITDKLKIGFAGTFYLDAFGEIGFYAADKDANLLFGYLVSVDKKDKGFDENVYLKIFSQNNVLDVYTCDEKVEIDGSRIKEYQEAYGLLGGHTKQMIRFSADENKVVTFVDTLYKDTAKEGEKSITETLPYGKYLNSAGRGAFSQTEVMSADTIVFVVPTDDTIDSGNFGEKGFGIKKRNTLRGDVSYNVASYRVDPRGAFEDAILMKLSGGFESITNTAPVMISEIKTGIDEDGNDIDIVTAYSGKLPTQYKTIDTSVLRGKNISKGDIVWFEQDLEGKIVSVIDVLVDNGENLTFKVENSKGENEKFYSKSLSVTGGSPSDLTNSTMESSFCLLYGYAGEIVDGVIRFAYTKEDCESRNYVLARNITSKPVIVYDKGSGKDGRIYWTAPSDIIDYQKGSVSCSNVVIFMRQNAVQCVYVYK